MICNTVDLYKYFKIPREDHSGGYLTSYIHGFSTEAPQKIRPAVLVLPGGGYAMCSDREKEPIALKFMSEGYASFTLEYTVNTPHPIPLTEACMAVAYIRENAKSLNVDPSHIAAIGFSAGGHLAASLGTIYGDSEVSSVLGKHAANVRPDAVVLSYPVITMSVATHGGTKNVICGGVKENEEKLSIEKQVTKESSPAFIWHTANDSIVPVANSIMLANAYLEKEVPFALHVFEKGRHGLSLANIETFAGSDAEDGVEIVGKWFDLAIDWLDSRGFIVKMKV